MVVHFVSPDTFSTQAGGHNLAMMNSVIFPPQGGTGNQCCTRQGSFTCPAVTQTKIPLTMALLPTDASTNNANTAAYGAGASAGSDSGWILVDARRGGTTQVGLPVRGNVGTALNGQPIFPNFNNVGCASHVHLPARLFVWCASFVRAPVTARPPPPQIAMWSSAT